MSGRPEGEPQHSLLTDSLFCKLSDREQLVLRWRYGLDDDHPITQARIARDLGVSRRTVGRIQAEALEKLRSGNWGPEPPSYWFDDYVGADYQQAWDKLTSVLRLVQPGARPTGT